MPNINQKIKPLSEACGLHRRINEIIDHTNWLMGIRTINGPKIGETTTGPTIDLGTQSQVPNPLQPWAVDPNGSSTGWTLITYLDASGNLWDMYVWSGIAFNERPCS